MSRVVLLLVVAAIAVLGFGLWLGRLGERERRAPASEDASRVHEKAGFLDLAVGDLLRPGSLAAVHADLEGASRCTLCHGSGSHVPDARCLSCHGEIAERAARKLPLHGTLAGDCASCHPDHRGAELSLVSLDREAFQHARTRFPLLGAHVGLDCESCHELADAGSDRTSFRFQGVPFGSCDRCHLDPHDGTERDETVKRPLLRAELGTKAAAPHKSLGGRACGDCHVAEGWARGFDHARDTHFELDPLHARLACASCHGDSRFSAAGRECADCHVTAAKLLGGRFEDERGSADPHDGVVSCAECHGGTPASVTSTALAARCVSCHDPAYGGLLFGWRSQLDTLASHAVHSRAPLERLRRSGPHNFVLSRKLLDAWRGDP